MKKNVCKFKTTFDVLHQDFMHNSRFVPRGPIGPGRPIAPAFPFSPFSPGKPSGPDRLQCFVELK